MSLAIDPWADGPLESEPAEQPDLTPEEWLDIREEIWVGKLDDHALFPDCLVQAVQTLGDLGMSGDPQTRRTAAQCLRAMAYRAKTGVPFNEPVEPAWSMDSERTVPR